MISDIPSFLRYFEGVHRRTVRDVASLPEEAETWTPPPARDAEASWGIPQIVRHVAEARPFFASAFVGAGWVWEPWPDELEGRASWVPALDTSLERLRSRLEAAPEDRVHARITKMGGEPGTISAWRALMMMAEHEVHHRSQVATYAGLNGWPVNQIFGRTSEWVISQLDVERARRGPEA